MKVYRYMSIDEFNNFKEGKTIVNNSDYSKRKTPSRGICFLGEKPHIAYDDVSTGEMNPFEWYDHLAGIVPSDILVEFEVDKKELTFNSGIYVDYPLGLYCNCICSEYYTNTYNKYVFKCTRYCDTFKDGIYEWKEYKTEKLVSQIIFSKVKPNAIIPSKDKANAGYDIYACIDKPIFIESGQTVLIPTGIACALPEDYYFQVEERGSTGSKGIKKSAGVIDSNYRGEIFIAITFIHDMYNYMVISNGLPEKLTVFEKDFTVEDNGDYAIFNDGIADYYLLNYPASKAIAQLVPHHVPNLHVSELPYSELLEKYGTDRGSGKLGSTGK